MDLLLEDLTRGVRGVGRIPSRLVLARKAREASSRGHPCIALVRCIASRRRSVSIGAHSHELELVASDYSAKSSRLFRGLFLCLRNVKTIDNSQWNAPIVKRRERKRNRQPFFSLSLSSFFPFPRSFQTRENARPRSSFNLFEGIYLASWRSRPDSSIRWQKEK